MKNKKYVILSNIKHEYITKCIWNWNNIKNSRLLNPCDVILIKIFYKKIYKKYKKKKKKIIKKKKNFFFFFFY